MRRKRRGAGCCFFLSGLARSGLGCHLRHGICARDELQRGQQECVCRAHGTGWSPAPLAKFVDSSSCGVGADSPSLLGGSWVVTSQVGFISRITAVMVYN